MAEYFDRELEILEQAFATEGGIKLIFKSKPALLAYRMKLYRRRIEDRRQVADTYQKPMTIGLSPYDSLMFAIYTEPDGRPGMHIFQPNADIKFFDKDGEPIEIKSGDSK